MDRFFGITQQGSNVRTELLAGLTTFLTMAYILFVNPLILGEAGMDKGAVFVATCLASAFGTAAMGLYANYPLALARAWGSTPISPIRSCSACTGRGRWRWARCSCPASYSWRCR